MRSSRMHCMSSVLPAILATIALGQAQGQTVLFSDAFDSEVVGTPEAGQFVAGPVGSTGWEFVLDEANQNDVRFGYDYSLINIPEAPNSDPSDTGTTGVALRTNVSAGAADQGGIYYEDTSFTGKYNVQVDMWLSWAADADEIGTTEHGGLFIGKDTLDNPASPDFPASTGAGIIMTGDGGTSNFDHTILKNNIYPSTASGQFSVSDFGFGSQLGYDHTDVNTDPAQGDLINLPELYPALTLPNGDQQRAGAAGFRWVTLNAEVDTDTVGGLGTGTVPGTTTFSVTIAETGESYTIGTLDNSVIVDLPDGSLNGQITETEQGPVDMSGRVTLTIIDFFTSVSSDINLGTVVFDNLLVTAAPTVLEGDYNLDGVVDAADYTVYRDTLGSTADLRADGNGNNAIDPGDLTVWADNYGATGTAVTAVPEPSTAAFCLLAAGALFGRRRHS